MIFHGKKDFNGRGLSAEKNKMAAGVTLKEIKRFDWVDNDQKV